MNKSHKIHFKFFLVFFFFAILFSYITHSSIFKESEKPWHMQPFENEDELPQAYTDKYQISSRGDLKIEQSDSSHKFVSILIDAWGVPFDIQKLEHEFSIFNNMEHKLFLRQRLANRTRHAEYAELRNDSGEGMFLFGGDSLEYGRNIYLKELGYSNTIFCTSCSDSQMIAKLDSLLEDNGNRIFAMTLIDARQGDDETLISSLTNLARLASKHKHSRFVIQGTHRPILGTPETRRKYYSRWVPAVILN